MNRRTHIQHRYVEFIPKDLDEGILYISKRFKTASHLCCCGCGSKVVTPLNPAKWRLVDHKSTVSLSPSIGLGALPCRSHYWISRSRIDWYPNMTDAQTDRAEQADRYASQVYTRERLPIPALLKRTSIARKTIDWWRRLMRRFRGEGFALYSLPIVVDFAPAKSLKNNKAQHGSIGTLQQVQQQSLRNNRIQQVSTRH